MDKERESQAREAESRVGELFDERLVLASSSPRRAEILRAVGWPFETRPVDIDESLKPGESPVLYVERLAREKAEAAVGQGAEGVVLGADTTVVVEGQMLAKPVDERDARRMLSLLSDRWHEVLTGVALLRTAEKPLRPQVAHLTTRVRFCSMTEEEINWYVNTGEPMDKAGAYAVQGRAALFIEEIEGDYWNIVGLPIRLVYKLVRER